MDKESRKSQAAFELEATAEELKKRIQEEIRKLSSNPIVPESFKEKLSHILIEE